MSTAFSKAVDTTSRSTPTCPKSSSPCRPAKSRPRRIASPTHSAPGLPATIISLRQSRVWVPACSQWLDEHRSTESQNQDCRQLFKSCRHDKSIYPFSPKIIKPMPSGEEPGRAALRAQRISAPDCRRRSSRCGNPVFGFLPARNGLMNTDRLSRNRIVDSFFKSCRHDKSIYPYVPKIISPCRPAKSRPRRIASLTHSAPGLPATIISLRQSRVWVPACSQWLDEHRSTESQQIVDSFFKSCRHDKSIYPYVPKIIKPMPSGEEPAAPHCEPSRIRHRDCRRRSSRCGNPVFGSCLLAMA